MLLVILLLSLASVTYIGAREFSIDYDNNQFLLDGEPFRYVSGSFHYFRTPHQLWRDRMRKMRAGGLNAISTYVEWSQHEPSPGVYDFEGDLNLLQFLDLAQEEDLLVLLRPGPYICAEREMGGLPPWLLTLYPDIQLRTSDRNYQDRVQQWFSVLMPLIQPKLYGNGGPIIMVQVENEYGSYAACDLDHTLWLKDQINQYVNGSAVLYTTDGNSNSFLRCGKIYGVYATVDFGSGANVNKSFQAMRQYEPRGPLVNSEFYPGWLTHWSESLQTVDAQKVADSLDTMLAANASVNIYVYHGGTNFGFMAGANFGSNYQPQITSYDYDAPMTEAGDPNEKYFALREVIGKYIPLANLTVPEVSAKGEYGSVELTAVSSILSDSVKKGLGTPQVINDYPLTFEALGQRYGFVLYETVIPEVTTDPSLLSVTSLGDRALILVDKQLRGVLSRAEGIMSLPLVVDQGQILQILVENQGRINYGSKINDFKGLLSNVTLAGVQLTEWNMTGFPLTSVEWLTDQTPGNETSLPAFFKGQFQLPEGSNDTLDTYLDPTGWDKGVAFINGFNLGRYWPKVGPQVTLYVPRTVLLPYPALNSVILLELERAPQNRRIQFVSQPQLNYTLPVVKMII